MFNIIADYYQHIKRALNKKGQGLVELALILGFCVGIGFLVRDSGLLDAMADSFNHGVSAFLTDVVGDGGSTPSGNGGAGQQQSNNQQQNDQQQEGENQQQGGQQQGGQQQGGQQQQGGESSENYGAGIDKHGKNWREVDPGSYYKVLGSEDRLAADRKALENLAKHFIGMKQFEVQALMRSAQTADMGYCDDSKMEGTEITLGHVIPNKDKNGKIIKGMKFRTNQKGAALKEEYEDDIFCWMQSEENASYDPTYMYLVSDYVVSQDWADKSGNNQQNGIKLRLEYDYSGQFSDPSNAVVIGAHVIIDPKSQHNTLTESGTDSNYNSMSSAGLDVQVRSDGNGGTYTTYHDTGRYFTADNINSDKSYGSYNWYGEGDYRLVQQYIADKAKPITNSGMQGFNKGDIVYTTNSEGKITGYYIAFKDGSQKVSSSSVQDYDPNNNTKKLNIFVKFETQIYRYWHENDKTKFIEANQSFEPKYIKTRGTVLTKDNGDMYVYVGDRTSNKNEIPFEGINNDWLLMGNIRQTN